MESAETGTTISGAGSVTLKADRDITARAATLSAGDMLTLDAGRDLTLYAGQNRISAETRHATKSGMNHYSLDATSQQTSLARTTLSATDIRLHSGNDTLLAAIEANASTLDIQASGKLIFATRPPSTRPADRKPRAMRPSSPRQAKATWTRHPTARTTSPCTAPLQAGDPSVSRSSANVACYIPT
nr:hemagglutinin repeat-containing protein [Variovorax guangxiensis]